MTQYIEKNKFEWGRRRDRREEKIPEEYEVWNGIEEGEMIEIMRRKS